jgi:hypothetical protein
LRCELGVNYARTSKEVAGGFRTSIEAGMGGFGGHSRTWVALGVGSFLGRYHFAVPDVVANGGLRPLCQPGSEWDF